MNKHHRLYLISDFKRANIVSMMLGLSSIITIMALYNGSDLGSYSVSVLIFCVSIISVCTAGFLSLHKYLQKFNILLFLIPFCYFIINTFNFNNNVGVKLGLGIVLPLCFASICSKRAFIGAYRFMIVFLAIESFLGLVALCDFMLNINILPHSIVPFYMEESHTYYLNYYFTYFYINESSFRFCGICNEPGFWGTITALALVSRQVKLMDKYNFIIFIGGILTFSVAYFSIIIIYFMIKVVKNKPVYFIIFLISGIFLFNILNNIKFENASINKIIERFQYDEKEGKFKGDNRSNAEIDKMFENTFISSDFFFGQGTGYVKSRFPYGVSGAKRMIVDWGFIGFIIAYSPIAIIALYLSKKNWNAISLTICFLISIYQRQDVFALGYITLLIGGILNIEYNDHYRDNIHKVIQ